MIVGIEGSFRLEMGWQFPTHKDFMLCNFNAAKQLDMKNVDAFVQTNVLGYLKNNMKDQHDFIDSTGKPRIVIEQATFRKNLDFDKPETNYYKVGLNHFTYDQGIFYNKNSPSDRWEKIKKEQNI
jgi:Ni,Fe-hydrogenase I large subunit